MSTLSTHGGDSFLAMSVHNIGFLLDRLAQDCHPLQYLRELTQNSIEAIQRTGTKGEIIWDVDWTTYDLEDGVYKLSITDNGDGTWTATSNAEGIIEMLDETTFQITSDTATYLNATTYEIESSEKNEEDI